MYTRGFGEGLINEIKGLGPGRGACNWKRKTTLRQAIEVSINGIERREGAWELIIGQEEELISGGLQSDLCFCLQVEGPITAISL